MFLKRVKIPKFRVLKDVDLTFEPAFTPAIFPLGSLNGGGKSTLLQLIFILLHCSFDEARHEYLRNLLKSLVDTEEDMVTVAEFEILHDDKDISLEFIIFNNGIDELNFDCYLRAEKIKKQPPQPQEPTTREILDKRLQSQNLFYVAHLVKDKIFMCKTNSNVGLVKTLSRHIYLASPYTQVLLFLSDKEKKLYFLPMAIFPVSIMEIFKLLKKIYLDYLPMKLPLMKLPL